MIFVDADKSKQLTGIYQIKNIVDDAHRIKTMLVEGYSTGEICDILDIPYRLVNNILSNDAWKNVYVDGWDDFQKSRIRKRGHPVSGRYKH